MIHGDLAETALYDDESIRRAIVTVGLEARRLVSTKPMIATLCETAKTPTLLVGIDLGTSQTAIAASTGGRHQLSSFVGKPKDTVSEKIFGKRLLFGEEAQRNRMSVELYRPLECGVIKQDKDGKRENIEAVKALIEHTVTLVLPKEDDVIYGVIGAPARAGIENKKAIIEAARGTLRIACDMPAEFWESLDG
jgi:actin-like ATPase involved in cell morphogenesis